jgi:hypothetical protein
LQRFAQAPHRPLPLWLSAHRLTMTLSCDDGGADGSRFVRQRFGHSGYVPVTRELVTPLSCLRNKALAPRSKETRRKETRRRGNPKKGNPQEGNPHKGKPGKGETASTGGRGLVAETAWEQEGRKYEPAGQRLSAVLALASFQGDLVPSGRQILRFGENCRTFGKALGALAPGVDYWPKLGVSTATLSVHVRDDSNGRLVWRGITNPDGLVAARRFAGGNPEEAMLESVCALIYALSGQQGASCDCENAVLEARTA